jgi:16S rRNA (cytosine967-C5)-methyltransferase
VQENCDRLGVTCVELSSALDFQPATFDRILVDAPCSNTGVLRRRVDLRWRLRPEEIERLQKTQRALLQTAATLLRPGGTLVYSTGFTLIRERQLLPFVDRVDGAYVASLRKS